VRSGKTERAELKPKPLQLRKTSPARIYRTLLPEHFLPALRHKHKHHPIAPRILPFPLHYWLFSLIATQNCLYFITTSIAPLQGGLCPPRAIREKRLT